jgi:hypothetical protein
MNEADLRACWRRVTSKYDKFVEAGSFTMIDYIEKIYSYGECDSLGDATKKNIASFKIDYLENILVKL